MLELVVRCNLIIKMGNFCQPQPTSDQSVKLCVWASIICCALRIASVRIVIVGVTVNLEFIRFIRLSHLLRISLPKPQCTATQSNKRHCRLVKLNNSTQQLRRSVACNCQIYDECCASDSRITQINLINGQQFVAYGVNLKQ